MAMSVSISCLHAIAGDGAETPAANRPAPAGLRAASELFERRCARCHDGDGTGHSLRGTLRTLPDFTSVPWQHERPTAQLEISILDGKGTHMPAFSDRITRKQARALADYVRKFAPLPESANAEQSAYEFQQQFRDLQIEFERLRKRFHDLCPVTK
jgi:mono/diheme cytochrome c family protein